MKVGNRPKLPMHVYLPCTITEIIQIRLDVQVLSVRRIVGIVSSSYYFVGRQDVYCDILEKNWWHPIRLVVI